MHDIISILNINK